MRSLNEELLKNIAVTNSQYYRAADSKLFVPDIFNINELEKTEFEQDFLWIIRNWLII